MSKIIVITGAGDGLGKHLARRFAAEGETLVLLGRTPAKVEAVAAEIGEQALAIACDVASPDSVRAAFARIAERHPKIDVLLNNAALFEPSTVAGASDAHIVNSVRTNLTGAIFCARAAIPMMRPGGHIINVSSEAVVLIYANLSLYQAAKAGLERFSLSLRDELEPQGLRVSLVRAGQMDKEGRAWDVDPEAAMQFVQANIDAGVDQTKRPRTDYRSATGVFRALIDLPPDMDLPLVQSRARFS